MLGLRMNDKELKNEQEESGWTLDDSQPDKISFSGSLKRVLKRDDLPENLIFRFSIDRKDLDKALEHNLQTTKIIKQLLATEK